MSEKNHTNICVLIEELSDHIRRNSPENVRLFEVFSQESTFARYWLDSSLRSFNQQHNILEVGAGLMILSCQLVREGYSVTALEPIADGFSGFSKLQQTILAYAQSRGFAPKVLKCSVEQLDKIQQYDFAYSVNVMEHIENVEMGIKKVLSALKTGASYRFTCPNYLFPYEPHFNIPTVFSKPFTEKLFRKQIFESKLVDQPKELWASLNWINVWQIKKIAKDLPNVDLKFNRQMIKTTFVRITTDAEFASRRSAWLRILARFIVNFKLHNIFSIFPDEMNPILDCTMIKK